MSACWNRKRPKRLLGEVILSEYLDRMLEANAEMAKLPPLPTTIEAFGQVFHIGPAVGNLFAVGLYPEKIRTDAIFATFRPRLVRGLDRFPR
jgi:hypothetical protein